MFAGHYTLYSDVENVIIIGSGPAGYTAALYTSRANLEPLVIEGFLWGGLLQQTTEVENYPGFREGIMGPELMQTMRDQAERFGTKFITDQATRVEFADEPGGVHRVFIGDDEYQARTVETGETQDVPMDGAFIAIGHEPQSEIVRGQVDIDDDAYVVVDGRSTRTNRPGVFAAGDLVDHTYRQAVTAAGSGCQAALDAEWYLRDTPFPLDREASDIAAAATQR